MSHPPLSLNQVTVSVTDVEASFQFYQKLGLHPIVKSPHYARFIAPGNQATFSIHLAEAASSSTIVYFETPELDTTVEQLKKQGIPFDQEPTDQRWGWREAYLKDPDGNVVCLYHAGEMRLNPPWRLP